MITHCKILWSPFLVLETPANYVFDSQAVEAAHGFLSSVSHRGIRIVWEARSKVTPELARLMKH